MDVGPPPAETPDRAVELVLGADTTCAAMESGKVRCWGNRTYFEPRGAVAELEGVHGMVIADSGWAERVCGLRGTGEVMCLALADDKRRVEAVGITARQLVAAGRDQEGLCALREDGSVTCWAQAYGYRQRDDTSERAASPHVIEGVPSFVKLHPGAPTCGETAAGEFHCWTFAPAADGRAVTTTVARSPARNGARSADGDVFVGADGHARIASTDTESAPAPWATPPLREVRLNRFMCGITAKEGRVVCGSSKETYLNANAGVLGLGHRNDALTDTWGTVELPAKADQIEVGSLHACALAGGQVYCWGENESGQLGRPRRSASTEPVLIPLPGRVKQVATHFELTCAVVEGERVHCWGDGHEFTEVTELSERAKTIVVTGGQDNRICGATSERVWCRTRGAQMFDLAADDAVEILAGWHHVCWRDASRRVFCVREPTDWTTDGAPDVTPIPDLQADSLLLVSGDVCARTGRGVRCFDDDASTPAFEANHDFDAYSPLFSSNESLCGVKDRGLYCVGFAFAGDDPELELSPFDASALSIGPFHSCSLAGGKVACWGSGQDGAGGYWGHRDAPTKLVVPFSVDAVAAGRSHTCLLSDGKVYCLGSNQHGQMATSPTDDVFPSPVLVDLH